LPAAIFNHIGKVRRCRGGVPPLSGVRDMGLHLRQPVRAAKVPSRTPDRTDSRGRLSLRGERVTMKLAQIQSHAGSFHHYRENPKTHFIRFGEPRLGPRQIVK